MIELFTTTIPGRARLLPSLALAIVLTTGCTAFRENVLSSGVTPNREKRATQAIREFEDRRDGAQVAAALDRLHQGDATKSEAMLTAIVNRRPDYVEARLRLAELLWSRGDVSAEQHLRAILKSQPNHAEAHHALGLLLTGANRPAEALEHFTAAAQLEPENEIFQTSQRSITDS